MRIPDFLTTAYAGRVAALQQRCLTRPFATAEGTLPPSHIIDVHELGIRLGLSVNK